MRKRQAELATYAGTDTAPQQAGSASEVKAEGPLRPSQGAASSLKPSRRYSLCCVCNLKMPQK